MIAVAIPSVEQMTSADARSETNPRLVARLAREDSGAAAASPNKETGSAILFRAGRALT